MIEQVVALGRAERNDWHTARIVLTATVPDREVARTSDWTDIAVVAVLAEGATSTRTVARLRPDASSKEWTGALEFERDDHLDRASLFVHVVATVNGVAGRIIGSSDREWIVDLTSDNPIREREIEVNTVSFARSTEWLASLRDTPWIVETSGNMPVLRMNSDFDGLVALIEGQGSKTEQMLGRMLLAQVCADVWTSVFHTAIGDLEIEDDGTPLFPPDWRGAVLREMLPDIFPRRSIQDALREVHTRRAGHGNWADLQPRIQYAAARRAEIPTTLAATVRGIAELDQEIHP
ncbi:hypothetical protein [Nocardia sp. NPDC051750]|uniref:hypothetical protein n=1 Tax=Nocardia sp. NPDC051750 TaxID=3364325 RepID=UPI003788026F